VWVPDDVPRRRRHGSTRFAGTCGAPPADTPVAASLFAEDPAGSGLITALMLEDPAGSGLFVQHLTEDPPSSGLYLIEG